MKFYEDIEGNRVAVDLIHIQYKCTRCENPFWDSVRLLEELNCPNKRCQKTLGLFDRKQKIKLNTILDGDSMNLPYRFRYGSNRRGFIRMTITAKPSPSRIPQETL